MSTSTFSIFSSIFGFVVAAISLFAFLTNICRFHLPSNRIKELESLMDETEAFFNKAVEDGLLIEPGFVRQTERHLTMLRTITYRLQSRVYNVTTLRQDYLEFLRGTSKSIGGTCQSLKKLKAQVIISSEKGRRRLAIVAHYFPFKVLDHIRVPQCFPDSDQVMRDMASHKEIHSAILHKVTRTYEQLMHKPVHQLFIRRSPSSLELECYGHFWASCLPFLDEY